MSPLDDPDGILALPEGFGYAVVTRAGVTRLERGQGLTPADHDGMAAYDAGRGRYRLIQNHEMDPGGELGVPHIKGTVYDPGAVDAGGCTVITTDRAGRNLSEDADEPNGLFYRWTAPRGVKVGPRVLTRLAPNAGVLAAMQIIMDDGSVLPDVAYLTSAQRGRPFPVRWVEVPERDAQTTPVREQFADGPCTAFAIMAGGPRRRSPQVVRLSSDLRVMPDQIFLLGNLVIMVAYAAIMVAIVVPVARAGQLRTNRLATATALIFFSCAVGHALHAVMAYRTIIQVTDTHQMPMDTAGWPWMSAVWDVFTAAVGVYYWTLRRGYGVLLGKGAIYVDPWGQRRLEEADARERAARDIAEAQRATLATVVEHTDDAVVGLTPEGVITAWNGGAERLFGYTAEEVIGEPAAMLADEEGSGEQSDVLARIRRGERGLSYETRRLRKDGTPVDVSLTVTPIQDKAGTVIGASAIARDITAAKEAAERRRAIEERTHQAQRMESLGKLAGGVAHDFNNILAIIANYTDFAIEETADRPGVQADLTQVRTAVDRATNLTRQLLTFTRGEAIQPQDVDLNAAIAEARMMLERTIGEHINLIAAPSPEPLTVHADPGQLQQVLLNLAVNARDAMPEGGTLVLEANSATLDGDEVNMQPPLPAGTYARLLVSDTGEGMSPETAARIFEPFYTTKPHGKGTGLGLATVYGIVTEAGGSINVYSEPGLGTTFRVYLPLVTAASGAVPAPIPADQAPPDGDGRTVLVVEDEPALARVITRILTDGGYHVVTAANGTEALDLYEQHGCDALLTDVIMPEMSGRRLAHILHERRPDLPVVYMSGYSNGLLGTTHILDEDIAFIEKPFTAADLLHKLASACERPSRVPH